LEGCEPSVNNAQTKRGGIRCIDCGALITSDSKRCKSCFTFFFGQSVHLAWQRGVYVSKPHIKHTEETKAKLSRKCKASWKRGCYKGSHSTPAFRALRSDIVTQEWREGKRKSLPPPHISGIENTFALALDALQVEYQRQYKVPGKRWTYDFYLPDYNALVEVDGVYWHSLPKMKDRDRQKDAFGAQANYIVLHVSENLIKNDVLHCAKEAIAKLKTFSQGHVEYFA